MRKLISLMALLLVCSLATTALAETKIGVFNFETIFVESDAGKATKNKVESILKAENDALVRVEGELKKKEADFATQTAALSPEKREERRAALIRDRRDHDDKTRAFLRKVEITEMRAKQGLGTGIQAAVTDYGSKNGYTVIMAGNTVLYAAKSADLTADLLKAVNAFYRSNPKLFEMPN